MNIAKVKRWLKYKKAWENLPPEEAKQLQDEYQDLTAPLILIGDTRHSLEDQLQRQILGERNKKRIRVTEDAILELQEKLEILAIDILRTAAQDAYTRTRIQGGREVTVDEDMIHLAYLDILAFSDTYDLQRYNDLREELLGGEELC